MRREKLAREQLFEGLWDVDGLKRCVLGGVAPESITNTARRVRKSVARILLMRADAELRAAGAGGLICWGGRYFGAFLVAKVLPVAF